MRCADIDKSMSNFTIRPIQPDDRQWVAQFIQEHWGSEEVIVHETVYFPHQLPGFIAILDGEKIGLLTYHLDKKNCEIVTLNSLRPNAGIGTALIESIKDTAQQSGCQRLSVTTTNDNLNALRFYQKRGFVLSAIRPNALEKSRQRKPEIPLIGENGIPLRDEIELELMLDSPFQETQRKI